MAPATAPGPTPAEKAFRSGEALEKAGKLGEALADYKLAAALGLPAAPAKVQSVTARLVQFHTRTAREALAKQDLDGSIRAWDRVLELGPDNETARLERQRVLRLKENYKQK